MKADELSEGSERFFAYHSLSGRKECIEYRDELCRIESSESVVGGEMEGAGLLSASDPESPSWIVAKGICDFADEERDEVIDETRPVACRNSATFVLDALKNEQHYAEI